MEQSKGLDGGTLKLMAAALMLIDHVGAILLPETVILRCIGRLAFPIFAFFIAEGYAHTRSFGRYLLRMAIWAAVSEIPLIKMAIKWPVPAIMSLRRPGIRAETMTFVSIWATTVSILCPARV